MKAFTRTFSMPRPVWEQFKATCERTGRKYSPAVVDAIEAWVARQERFAATMAQNTAHNCTSNMEVKNG